MDEFLLVICLVQTISTGTRTNRQIVCAFVMRMTASPSNQCGVPGAFSPLPRTKITYIIKGDMMFRTDAVATRRNHLILSARTSAHRNTSPLGTKSITQYTGLPGVHIS